jgi:hypothetical protein
MKRILLLFCLCVLSLNSWAGEGFTEKGFFAIRTGLSVPQGNFGSLSANNQKAGLAVKGFHVAAEYGNFLNDYFGLSGTFGIRRHDLDLYEVNRAAMGPKLYAQSKWRTSYLLGNVLIKYPVSQAFSVYLKGGAGLTFNTLPQVTTTPTGQTDQKVTAEALAYGWGGGIKSIVENRVGFGLEIFSIHSEPTFKNNNVTVKQEMNALNYSLSISYQFN